jgi:hypothetical protein
MKCFRYAGPPHARRRLLCIFLLLVFAASPGASTLAGKADAVDRPALSGALVLPHDHAPVPEMNIKACIGCHPKAGPRALPTKIHLGHLHQLNGVTCRNCHGDTLPPAALATDQCLACHGDLEKVSRRTADIKPHNPHSSPHGKTYSACDLCHHQHDKSENFCAQCHDFEYAVP